MGKFFASVSTLWVLFIPLISLSNVGVVDLLKDSDKE